MRQGLDGETRAQRKDDFILNCISTLHKSFTMQKVVRLKFKRVWIYESKFSIEFIL